MQLNTIVYRMLLESNQPLLIVVLEKKIHSIGLSFETLGLFQEALQCI